MILNYSRYILSTGLVIAFFVLVSCNSNNETDIIPRENFINILTELHLADAVLTEKSLYDRKLKDSTDSYYNYVLVKHNMSRNKFDISLIHYARDMEDFSLIYDQVIENIKSKNEVFNRRKSIFNLPMIVLDSINLANKQNKKSLGKREIWNKKKDWSLPNDGKLNTIKFEKAIFGQSRFELSAEIMIFKDDKSINPTMLSYIFYKDGSNKAFKDTTLVKDGKWHTYKLTAKTNPAKIPTKIACKIADHDTGTKNKHMKIRKISLKKFPIITKPELPKNPNLKKKNIRVIEKSN
ncbi:MAG: DUF4296 domain-containing protein [Bacteroidota bacterium]